MSVSLVSQKGLDELKAKLNYLMKDMRKQIAQELATARAHGDLSENAEYDAAKEKLNNNEREIKRLNDQLLEARVLDDSKIDKNKAFIGATVTIFDYDEDEEVSYTLVSEIEADVFEGKISVASPLSKALLGHKVGDEIVIEDPAGDQKYKILKITRD